jgi:hypothetical protein
MLGRIWTWVVVATGVAALSCGSGEPPADGRERPIAGRETTAIETGRELPPVSVLIIHRVADFDAWKTAFDADRPAREEATCLGHYLKRGVDDPDTVYVYCLATDPERLRAFLESDELAERMREAGVVDEPTMILMEPMSRDLVAGRLLPGIIAMHAVEDYVTWRSVYDELDGFRDASGIVGDAVSRRLDDPNRVIVYHQAESVEELRVFAASPELEDAMMRGGVVGQPDVRFIRVVDFADY